MTVIQGSNLVIGALLLSVVSGAEFLSAFSVEQVDALGMLFLDASSFGVLVWGILFGLHLAVLAWLVYRSGFLPKWIGILLAFASLGYLAQSLGAIVAPGAADVLETVVLISLPGELALMFWLLIKGVEDDTWLAVERQAA
jgi:hypothetical protein